jgi:SET family sugar efflux transporter-like MFS transporter
VKLAHYTRHDAADRSPRFGRAAIPLGITAGCYGITISVSSTITSLFLANAVHVGPLLIGVYFTGCAVAGIGVNLAAGRVSDRLADRRVALAVTGLAGVAGTMTFIVARNYAVVFAAGAVLLTLGGAYFSQLFAYVKELADAMGRDVVPFNSAVRSVFSAAWVVGPAAGFFLLAHAGFGALYASSSGLLLVTALLGRWFLPVVPASPGSAVRDSGDSQRPGMRQVLATVQRRTWLLLGSVTAVYVADQMYLIVIALYVTKDRHLSATLVGLMAGICAALEIPLMIAVGRLAERIGKLRLVAAAVVIAVIFFCLMPLAASAPFLIALQLPNAMWTAVVMSIPMAMAQQEIPGGSGTVSAFYTSTFTVAQLLAGAISGIVAAQAGYGGVFWFCAGLCALASVLLLFRVLA